MNCSVIVYHQKFLIQRSSNDSKIGVEIGLIILHLSVLKLKSTLRPDQKSRELDIILNWGFCNGDEMTVGIF